MNLEVATDIGFDTSIDENARADQTLMVVDVTTGGLNHNLDLWML